MIRAQHELRRESSCYKRLLEKLLELLLTELLHLGCADVWVKGFPPEQGVGRGRRTAPVNFQGCWDSPRLSAGAVLL